MSGSAKDIGTPQSVKSEQFSESEDTTNTSSNLQDPEPMNHHQFFKLSNITIKDDDVTTLVKQGFDMDTILFIVNNGSEGDIDEILIPISSKIPKALSIRFRNMCLILRDYMVSSNGQLFDNVTMTDVMEWNNLDKYLTTNKQKPNNNNISQNVGPSTSNANLVARMCQTIKDTHMIPLPKIREQQYQVEWEEEVKPVMGSNNASYLLDEKVLKDDFSECTVDVNIIQIQDSKFWFDLAKAVRNSDVEHTILKYEQYWPNGQNRASGRKAWLAIT